MRILHLGKYFSPASGGIERFLGDLIEAQRSAGHQAVALVHEHGGTAPGGDPEWLLRCPVWMRLLFAPISPRFPFWLARAIRRLAPEVLHIHLPNVSPFWALLLPSARRIPWVIHWHSDVEPSRFKRSLRLAYPGYRIFERAMLERAEAIIVTSPQYLASSAALRPWHPKCRVIPLGVAPARLPEVNALEGDSLWPGAGMRCLAVGRLTYYKGFDTLVSSVANTPGLQLVIAGDGEEGNALRDLLRRQASRNVRLLGEVDEATLCRLLASCDVLCLSSRERTEAFGLVLVEAMRYARPLVVSNLPGSGVAHVARSGQNAVVVAVDDIAAWRCALVSLAGHAASRRLLGHLGHERYLREFDIAMVERRIARLYEFVAREEARKRETHPEIDGTAMEGTPAARSASRARPLVVIPALNESECIGRVIAGARAAAAVEILVVDDGSTDDTVSIALLHGATVVRAPLWQGAWGAIQTGIRHAVRHGYPGVITMDADGQHEPEQLCLLIEAARHADVVIAACPARGSALRHLAWRYFRLLTGFAFEDLTSGFRYYNAAACRLLASEEATLLDYQDIGVLMLLRHARLRIAEIPVAMNARRNGASRVFFSWWTVARYMAETTLLCLARWNPRQR